MPETTLHLVLRTFLFQLLRFTWGKHISVGSDQFVYWRANDPKTCLAPDAFLKLDRPFEHFDSWKTWERGTPELAVEILSDSDRPDWENKLLRYRDLGVRELVCFDPAAPGGERLRVWDRVSDDLIERALETEAALSLVLTLDGADVYWATGDVEGTMGLRLAKDPASAHLLPSEREAEAEARKAAEARIRELEAELARRGGS